MIERRTYCSITSSAWRRIDIGFALAVLLSVLAALPLLVGPGIVNTRAGGDSPFLLQRTYDLAASIRGGAIPAQWMSVGAYGLGYPFYRYYASFPYYLAAILDLAGAGVLWGIKLTQLAGFVLAGISSYALARRIGAHRGAALLSSAVYTFAPFHLVNVYVRGDALSEFYAMALYPLILLTLLRLEQHLSARNVALLALSYGLLMVSHNVSALLFTPLLGLALVLRASTHKGRIRWTTLGYGVAAMALGLLLSAWFWIPALQEQSLVQLQDQTTGYFNYAGHFRSSDLVQLRIWHDYAIDGNRNPFSMGLGQAILALAGVLILCARTLGGKKVQPLQGFGLLALALSTWLLTPTSRWIWDHLPLLPMVQFPWRLFSVQALAISLLSTQIPAVLPPKVNRIVAAAAVILAGVTGMAGLRVDRLPLREADVSPERLEYYETFSGNIGSTVRYEYLPREMVPRPYGSAVQWNEGAKPAPLVLAGELISATCLRSGVGWESWRITARSAALLAFHTTYIPGWQATVDGRAHSVEPLPGLGLLGLRLQPGDHQIDLRLTRTRTRDVAWGASLGGLAIWLGLTLYDWSNSSRTRRWGMVGGASLILCAAWISISPQTKSVDGTPQGPLVADFSRAPYLHEETEGVVWGQARLIRYGLSKKQVLPGQTLRLSTTWEHPWPQYQVRVSLVAATGHLLEPAPTWAEGVAALDDTAVSMELTMPDDIPPGLYVLRISAWSSDGPETPRTVAGVKMGTLTLEPIRVVGRRQATGNESVLGSFGPENAPPVITLVGADLDRMVDMLLVQLEWRSERQAPLNYILSVRLRDNEGKKLSRDLPPLLGNYATSLWHPGELISDRILIPWPDGRPLPGGSYDLEVVLYDRLTLKAVGTATIPVTLEQ